MNPILKHPNLYLKMLLLSFFLYPSLCVLLLFLLYKHKLNHRFHPPGPPPLPLIGNLHQLMMMSSVDAPHLLLQRLSKLYGPLMSLHLGLTPSLVVSSAKMAKEVMKVHEYAFRDRPSLLAQHKLSYNALDLAFSRYDEYNKLMKKTCVVNLFNVKRVQSFRPVREEEVRGMIQNIATSCTRSTAHHHELITNLSEKTMGVVSNIISRVAFGRSYEEEGSERSRFRDMINEAETVLESFCVFDYFPLMGWVDRLSGWTSKVEKSFKECDEFYQQVIDAHLDDLKVEGGDIVDVLLGMHKDQLYPFAITLPHIKAILMDIFVGGTYPSAALLINAMEELVNKPRVMEKAQQEIRGTIGEKKGFVNEDDLQRFPYMKAVVKETMRLHPPIPLIPRESTQKCTINGYVIEPKTLVFVNAWAIGRDQQVWENSEEFFPERFLTSSSIDFRGQNFELIPFGSGRRSCPGMLMGAVTVELLLANLLYAFNWDIPKTMMKEGKKCDPLCLVPRRWDSLEP